jgi:hypothetical protein
MNSKHLTWFLFASLIEGCLTQAVLLTMQFESSRGHLINYTALRWVLAGIVFFFLMGLLIAVIGSFRHARWSQRFLSFLDMQLMGQPKHLFFVQSVLLVAGVFLFECFLLSYLAFPIPTRPLFFWASLTSFQAWLILRIAYKDAYRKRPCLAAGLRAKWNGLLSVQRKVFIILAIIGFAYFLFFIPTNMLPNKYGQFNLLGDEQVIYPDVVKIFNPQPNFAAAVQNILGTWEWWYGYPYLPISASVLIIPRLIFGAQFASHIPLNIGLMRQFVSVLPMVLAIMLAVYLVTRFKSVLASVSMFSFLLLVPGIVKINIHFWHPDSIVLFLVLLTIYFLQKDDLRFGQYFSLAAVVCGLATAIKLWGLFFVLAIAGYLVGGLFLKKLTLAKCVRAGVGFILVMILTIIISSPSLMAPYITQEALKVWKGQQQKILLGPSAVDTAGMYVTNLPNWLKYFGYHYMKGYFFFFAYIALAAGSLWGAKKYLNRILLAWCVPTTIFLVYFSAMKNFQYLLPLAVPLFCGAFLFPTVSEIPPNSKMYPFLGKPPARKIIQGVTIALFASQLIINLIILYLLVIRGR